MMNVKPNFICKAYCTKQFSFLDHVLTYSQGGCHWLGIDIAITNSLSVAHMAQSLESHVCVCLRRSIVQFIWSTQAGCAEADCMAWENKASGCNSDFSLSMLLEKFFCLEVYRTTTGYAVGWWSILQYFPGRGLIERSRARTVQYLQSYRDSKTNSKTLIIVDWLHVALHRETNYTIPPSFYIKYFID